MMREFGWVVMVRVTGAFVELATILFMAWLMPESLMRLFRTGEWLSPAIENLGYMFWPQSQVANLYYAVLSEGTFAFGFLAGTFGLIIASLFLRVIARMFRRGASA